MAWTLEELVERAARALAEADVRVANGRVTGVPDGRLIRWYTTIGLVDRPLAGPGRAARYGERHLLQLVSVKRLQAEGHPLVEIQRRLAGATDTTLRRIADLNPGDSDPGRADGAPLAVPRSPGRFWAEPVAIDSVSDSVIASEVRGVRLGEVTVLFAGVGELGQADLDEIARAAAPLLEVLRQKGVSS